MRLLQRLRCLVRGCANVDTGKDLVYYGGGVQRRWDKAVCIRCHRRCLINERAA